MNTALEIEKSGLRAKKLAGALGAELTGLELAKGLDASQASFVRNALLEHQVVFIRNQSLSPGQFMRFAESMGEPLEYPFVRGIEGYPCIIEVKKLEHEKANFGGVWHSDTTYLDEPPMGSMLLAREIPPYGGDTLFANQYMAYETLSAEMKRIVDPLIGIASSAQADVSKTREDRIKSDGSSGKVQQFVAEHPAVRTHPETGRKALYVNAAHTAGFKGMTDAESKPLLEFLFQHQVKPEFTCRFAWEVNSIALWDNRCTQHNPINDYHGFRRVMQRITLKGDRPR